MTTCTAAPSLPTNPVKIASQIDAILADLKKVGLSGRVYPNVDPTESHRKDFDEFQEWLIKHPLIDRMLEKAEQLPHITYWHTHAEFRDQTAQQHTNRSQLAKVGVDVVDDDKGLLRCQECGERWLFNLHPGGRRSHGYWKCPKGCNIGEQESDLIEGERTVLQ